MILLTRSVSDVRTGILVETLEPPTIATSGRCGSLITPSRYFNSCAIDCLLLATPSFILSQGQVSALIDKSDS